MAATASSDSPSTAGGSIGTASAMSTSVRPILIGKPSEKALSAGATRVMRPRATSARNAIPMSGPAICSAETNIVLTASVTVVAVAARSRLPSIGRASKVPANPCISRMCAPVTSIRTVASSW